MLLNCGIGEDSWVPLTSRSYNQSIWKEISPEYSLKGLILKLQCFGRLMRRADSFVKTLMLGKFEGGRRKGQQRICLEGIADSMDMNLSKLLELLMDREGWHAEVPGVTKSWSWLSNWVELNFLRTKTKLTILSNTNEAEFKAFVLNNQFCLTSVLRINKTLWRKIVIKTSTTNIHLCGRFPAMILGHICELKTLKIFLVHFSTIPFLLITLIFLLR